MRLDIREIPTIYMNLERHVEKNNNMQRILSECGFKHIIRVEGVDVPDRPIVGCSLAHYKALQEIDGPFILFEDDCMPKNFRPEIEIPENADAVYLGISSWGRMNGHSGPYVQYEKINDDLYRIYNMLSGHAILYLSKRYIDICKSIAYHCGSVTGGYHDIGFAEIQRWFNVYTFDNPFFYQTSGYHGTINPLTSYPMEECFQYNKNYFLPEKIL